MKKFLFLSTLVFPNTVLLAQSVEEGQKHLYYQRYYSAANSFQSVVKEDPKNDQAWYGLVKSYISVDELQQAKEVLQTAPEAVQDDAYYYVAKGEILLAENKAQEAAPLFEKALDETNNKDAYVMLAIADAHNDARNGNAAYAVELLKKAIERKKEDPALYVALGDAYRKLHNSSEGYKAYRDALNLNGNYAPALYNTGDIFLSQKNREMYLNYFDRAVKADPAYAPALYRLYLYHFSYNPEKAMEYYKQYMANADKGLQNDYDIADLNYLNKDYKAAIDKANSIISQQGEKTKPRLYKLIGYSQAALADTASALQSLRRYFAAESDSNVIAKDYEILANLYAAQGQTDSAAYAFSKAVTLVQDSTETYPYYKNLVDLYKGEKDFANEAKWSGMFYTGNPKATNVDLFNWALAHYRAEEYAAADSVFGLYVSKYPDQSFGYYWQARANAARDSGMKEGLAIPHYQKLVELLQKEEPTESNKKWMMEAYNYMAAYETNTTKNYSAAIEYFDKVLELNPEDADAKKYKAMLEKTTTSSTGGR
ncbi:tetratricopeptide repeat protein [Flavisolibacter sp. BT320]|nr:tetratricopeptide repeat protein [Flavisolibacter longurius]